MKPTNCLNCSAALTTGQHFCARCGQKTPVHRITFMHFLHEFFHAFTHTDRGILHLLKELILHPGQVAREYMAGKRKKYFNPFTFFLLVMTLFVFSSTFFAKDDLKIRPDPGVLAQIPTEAGKQQYVNTITRVVEASGFMKHYGNVVGMIAVPFLSLITWLFYRRRGYNYAEHLTANLLFTAFNNLYFAILIVPLESLQRGSTSHLLILFTGLLMHSIYLSWGMSGFLGLRGFRQRTGAYMLCIFATMIWCLLTLTAMAIYIYRSWDFWQFFRTMSGK
jgi:hypothetical protein